MLSAICCLTVVAGSLAGPQPQLQPKQIKVTVVAILASECEGSVDPRLKAIAEEVQKLHPQLKRFAVANITNQSFKAGEKATFKLVEAATADVTIFCCGDMNDRVGIRVVPPLQGEIDYRAVCGKFLPIVTRYYTLLKPSPCRVAGAVAQMPLVGFSNPFLAAARLETGCKSDLLILAIRVQPCTK